jgi:hypothetical protein
MAYDPNDEADVAIVEAKVNEATSRLKSKNEELIGELRKAREGKVDADKVERLERDLEESRTKLDEATKAKTKAEKDAKAFSDRAEANEKRANALSVSTALAQHMAENKIAPQFHEAVQAMFGPKATFKVENGVETVMVGDKSLGDAIKEFAGSDTGKFYVANGNNAGGGAQGGGADRGSKTLSRQGFDALAPEGRMEFVKSGGTITDS